MISIDEAIEQVKLHIPHSASRTVLVNEALGCYLAADISAPEPSPRYTSSAMDGFGIRYDQSMQTGQQAIRLKIIGESAAGKRFNGLVQAGEAVRINTGAVIPDGVDTVIRVEDTSEEGDEVLINVIPKQGQDIRHAGEEFDAETIILNQNTKLSATHLALLSAVGISAVAVYDPCKVSVLVTGSELVSCGDAIAPDQIRDSNMIMIAAAIREAGGEVLETIRVEDDAAATEKAIGQAKGAIIICTGGISVGPHDHVKGSAHAVGFKEIFWRIRQKPGKPLFFGRRGKQLFFGLPGNPVSAFMCFIHYVKPLIGAINGFPFGWPIISAKTEAVIENRGKRPTMVRVQLKWKEGIGYSITSAEKQGSHMLTSITESDGYIILDAGEKIETGNRCEVHCYESSREIFHHLQMDTSFLFSQTAKRKLAGDQYGGVESCENEFVAPR